MAAGFYWTANSPFIQGHWVRLRRAPRAAPIGNVESGFIDLDVDGRTHRNANAAHMIYECLTNTVWGMGAPDEQMDASSFAACAQTYRDEGFGLFMTWVNSDTIENFVQEVLDHVQAVLFLSPVTGLWTLKNLRADYVVADLPVYTVDDATFVDFARKLPGETVNQIDVKWTNPRTEQEETVTAQDLAGIVTQGGQVVSQDRNYYGVRSGDLAARLATRDLRTASAPLATCTMRANRKAWSTTPGQCIRITVPDEDAFELVMRVSAVDYGDRSDAYVKVSLVEDIFAYDAVPATASTGTAQDGLAMQPNAPAYVNAFTLPAFMVANSGLEMPVDPEVIAGVLVGDANVDFLNVEPYTEVTLANGTITDQSIGTRDRIGVWLTTAPLVAAASSTFAGFPGLLGPGPRLAGFAFIGDSEIALVQAIDEAGNYTLARGVLDTVPRAWPTGTPIWFLNTQRYVDPTLRAPGETVSYRPLMRTSLALLAYDNGIDTTITMTDRPYLPLRPANVRVNGQGFGTVDVTGDASVTWSNRNRLSETGQVLAWTAASVTPEDGQTTTVRVLSSSGSTLHTYTGLSGSSFTVPAADLVGGAFISASAVTSEGESFQSFRVAYTSAAGIRDEEGGLVYDEEGRTILPE